MCSTIDVYIIATDWMTKVCVGETDVVMVSAEAVLLHPAHHRAILEACC